MRDETGRVGWLELNAQRVAQAALFYERLFAWQMQPLHVPPWGSIPLIASERRVFANQFMAMGAFAVPRWIVWLVADLERAAARAVAQGASEPSLSEIPGNSRRLDGRDPHGISYGLIEPAAPLPDTDRPGEPYAAELWGGDVATLGPFYADLLGLEPRITETGIALGGSGAAPPRIFLRESEFEVSPPRWVPYFRSASVGADMERARRLGAIVQVHDATAAAIGRHAVLADPSGAAFGLVEPPA